MYVFAPCFCIACLLVLFDLCVSELLGVPRRGPLAFGSGTSRFLTLCHVTANSYLDFFAGVFVLRGKITRREVSSTPLFHVLALINFHSWYSWHSCLLL